MINFFLLLSVPYVLLFYLRCHRDSIYVSAIYQILFFLIKTEMVKERARVFRKAQPENGTWHMTCHYKLNDDSKNAYSCI